MIFKSFVQDLVFNLVVVSFLQLDRQLSCRAIALDRAEQPTTMQYKAPHNGTRMLYGNHKGGRTTT